jgi:predicted O-linked N-acetylglucosamine transferase (SPINDLY family)
MQTPIPSLALALAARSSHDHEDAFAILSALLANRPDDTDVALELADLCIEDLRRPGVAIDALANLLARQPDHARANLLCGIAHGQLGHFVKAAQHSVRAFLASGKRDRSAADNLVAALTAMEITPGTLGVLEDIAESQPDNGIALLALIFAQLGLCDWKDLATRNARYRDLSRHFDALNISPYRAHFVNGTDNACLRATAEAAARLSLSMSGLDETARVETPRDSADGRLRIGYFCSDLHEHPTSHLLVGVLEAHDRQRFHIHAYSHGPEQDVPMRTRVKAAFETFRDLRGLEPAARARILMDDGLDILVDLDGWIHRERFKAGVLRPAPVIANWLGYPGTMGRPGLADYIIGDPIVTPLEHAAAYTEAIAQMPYCYQPNDDRREIATPPGREAAGLPPDGLVFCSFNVAIKITPEVFDIWCDLLRNVPGSVLWLLDPKAVARANLAREASARSVDPTRLVFAPRLPLRDHLARLSYADLALDTAPYNSHTTASDTLWAGVPMVTWLGDTFPSRVGASLLHAVGLDDCIAADMRAYRDLALELARDPARLAALRARLHENRLTAPLFDTARFTRDLEALYARMWANHLAGRREHILATPG